MPSPGRQARLLRLRMQHGRIAGLATEQRPRIQADTLHLQIAQQPVKRPLLLALGEERRMAHFYCYAAPQLCDEILQLAQALRPEASRQLQPQRCTAFTQWRQQAYKVLSG